MTICVAVRVNDCIVFATDSASTLSGPAAAGGGISVVNVYEHADKLYNLYKGLPVCAMTCGLGNIDKQSISSIVKDIRLSLKNGDAAIERKNYSIESIVRLAYKIMIEERYINWAQKPTSNHSLEFYVGGYSANSEAHELWKFAAVNGAIIPPAEVSPKGTTGLNWAGQPEPINRLVLGVSQSLPQVLKDGGMPDNEIQTLVAQLVARLTAPLWSDAMPVHDAIDLAGYLVDLTKSYYRFHPGANIVGGATDIAVVTRHEGFKWIERKHYYRTALNPLETDHVDITP